MKSANPQVERLLRATTTLLIERGRSRASVSALLDAARVSRPLLYYHFGSKDGLLDAVGLRVLRQHRKSLAAARTVTTPRGRIIATCMVVERGSRMRCALGEGNAAVLFRECHEQLWALLADGISIGAFRACDTRAVAATLVACAQALGASLDGDRQIAADVDHETECGLEARVAVVLRGIAP